MNNVWNSVVCRAAPSATARPIRTKPLLHLFSGYARSQSTTSSLRPQFGWTHSHRWCTRRGQLQEACIRSFSASSCLEAKNKDVSSKLKEKRARAAAPKTFGATLEPAPVAASHTEGVPHEEEVPLTWRDYDPAGGMPLPSGELGQAEINAIFDREDFDHATGNYVLSVMHWRRLSGALIDVGLDFPKDSGVDRKVALQALQYIRQLLPDVDETAAGQIWAEEESKRMQEQIQDRSVRLGLYQRSPDADEEESDQGTEYGRERSGKSALEGLREANEARWEKERAEKAIADQQAETTALHVARGPLELDAGVQPTTQDLQLTPGRGGVSIRPPDPKAWLAPVERKPWVKYYEEQATIIKENHVPQLSAWKRLGPCFLMLLLVSGGCYYLSENYTPPPKSARIWPDTPPSVATMYGITGVLLTTFLLGRIPPLWRAYSKYMTLVPAYPYAVSLIGATLRHDSVRHLASNLVSLWLFGLLLHEDVGRGTFLAIYLASGVTAGYTSLLFNAFRGEWTAYIFGASGSVLGVVAAACAVRPNGTIHVFGYDVPIAAWVFLALYGSAEAFAAVRGMNTGIDHAGHLGGMLMGVAAGLALRMRGRRERQEAEANVLSEQPEL